MVQRLRVSARGNGHRFQRDPLVGIDLEEEADEVLGKVTQPLVVAVLEVVSRLDARQRGLVLAIAEGEAGGESRLKRRKSGNMA